MEQSGTPLPPAEEIAPSDLRGDIVLPVKSGDSLIPTKRQEAPEPVKKVSWSSSTLIWVPAESMSLAIIVGFEPPSHCRKDSTPGRSALTT